MLQKYKHFPDQIVTFLLSFSHHPVARFIPLVTCPLKNLPSESPAQKKVFFCRVILFLYICTLARYIKYSVVV